MTYVAENPGLGGPEMGPEKDSAALIEPTTSPAESVGDVSYRSPEYLVEFGEAVLPLLHQLGADSDDVDEAMRQVTDVQTPSGEVNAESKLAVPVWIRRWQNAKRQKLPFDYFIDDPETYDPADPNTPLVPLPTFDTVVDTSYRKHLATHKHDGVGTTWLEKWRMSDGIKYKVMICEPNRARSNIVIAKDLALGTQPEGFNEDVADLFMRLGFTVIMKGPEIGGSIPLAHSAHNTHQILDITDRIGYHEPKVAAVEGYSRGGEVGLGTVAKASENDRRIIFANFTDACMGKPIRFDRKQLESFMQDAPHEVLTAMQQFGKLAINPGKAWHYRKTIDASLAGGLQFVRTARPVFSGEGGYLARHLPEDANILMAFLGQSMQSDEDTYRAIMKDLKGASFKSTETGGHLAGLDDQILTNISRVFGRLMVQLDANVHHSELDYSAIHLPQVA
jgi:hypothetical protein